MTPLGSVLSIGLECSRDGRVVHFGHDSAFYHVAIELGELKGLELRKTKYMYKIK